MRLYTGDVCFRCAMEGGYDLSIDVFGVVWGVLILRIVGLLALAHGKPLSNTPGIASVGGKKGKNSCNLKMVQAGFVCIRRKHTHALLKV